MMGTGEIKSCLLSNMLLSDSIKKPTMNRKNKTGENCIMHASLLDWDVC